MKRLLITGATGFVGGKLCRFLVEQGFCVRAALRRAGTVADGVTPCVVGEIDGTTDWSAALEGVEAVVHLAARVPALKEHQATVESAYQRVNVLGTRHLAEAARDAGVRQFILLSSIKVLGETSAKPFSEQDEPAPQDAYGRSKLAAEQMLMHASADSGMRSIIIRVPLLYGPGVKGNLANLIALAGKGWPLPFGGLVENRRSLLYVENLNDFIAACLRRPLPNDEIFLLADDEALSTDGLFREIRSAMGLPARIVNIPQRWFSLTGRLTGQRAILQKLCDSLEVCNAYARRTMDWRPPFTFTEGMRATVKNLASAEK